jgi:hypothetical protein
MMLVVKDPKAAFSSQTCRPTAAETFSRDYFHEAAAPPTRQA